MWVIFAICEDIAFRGCVGPRLSGYRVGVYCYERLRQIGLGVGRTMRAPRYRERRQDRLSNHLVGLPLTDTMEEPCGSGR